MKKAIIIILDGLGDRPHKQLNFLTPLEAAHTPNMNRLAERSMLGMVDPILPGLPVGTQTGTGLLMGLSPDQISRLSRGVVEAMGVMGKLDHRDVAIRCNFATVKDEGERLRIIDRRAERIREGTIELEKILDSIELSNGVTARFHCATQHRAVLVLTGDDLSSKVTDTDPGSMADEVFIRQCRSLAPGNPAADKTAAAVNEFTQKAHKLLAAHPLNKERARIGLLPANAILCRGAGKVDEFPSFISRLGLKASVVAGEYTILGLARLFQFEAHTSPAFTSLVDTDLGKKVELALSTLDHSDLAFLHVKAPDIFSHDKNPVGKKQFLERLDQFLQPILERDLVIGITADHTTNSQTGNHTGDPVPSLIYSSSGRFDHMKEFGEQACMCGGLGRLNANHYLISVLDAMDALAQDRATYLALFKPK